jgi:hypothetical protein
MYTLELSSAYDDLRHCRVEGASIDLHLVVAGQDVQTLLLLQLACVVQQLERKQQLEHK